jgi:hypothetical protein
MSNPRFSGSIPSMVSSNEADQQDDELSSLMDDYARATQLQISLRKRIDVLMKEREIAAQAQEEAARAQLEEALSKNRKMMENNLILRMKMKQMEQMGEPARDNTSTKEIVDDHIMGPGTRGHSPAERRGRSPTRSLRSRSHSPVIVGASASRSHSRSPSPMYDPRLLPPQSLSVSPVMIHRPSAAVLTGFPYGSRGWTPCPPSPNPGVIPVNVSLVSIATSISLIHFSHLPAGSTRSNAMH